MSEQAIPLFRPVGQAELDLIEQSGFAAFPPRLDWQPIFYPVLNEEYATFIAREWNTRDFGSGFVGYVLRFSVSSDFLQSYDVHQVGSATAREYWIPAEQLPAFNAAILGKIEIVARFGDLWQSHPEQIPLVSDAELTGLAAAWIEYQHADKRSGQVPSGWASDLLDEFRSSRYPEETWRAILRIHELDESGSLDPVIAAGPIEDLLSDFGDRFIARVERQARADPRFARTLGGVWQHGMSDEVWARVQAVWDRRGWDGIPE